MVISEKLLRKLIQESINEALTNQDRLSLHVKGDLSVDDIEQGVPLYHRPADSNTGDKLATIKSLMTTGFSREYTGDNGGNMYGPGVYNVYTLKSSNEKARGYGKYIVKSYLLGGWKDFLVFNIDMAKEVYGSEWEIDKQIEKLFPSYMAKKVFERFNVLNSKPDYSNGLYSRGALYMNNNATSMAIKTSNIAVKITDFLGGHISKTKVRGIIYSGNHDGECAFVRNFSEVIPHSYSDDNGKTWKKGITDELVWRAGHDTDVFATLKGSGLFDDVADRSINGFVIVKKGGKYNYFNVAENDIISNVWFDRAFNFDDGIAEVQYGDKFFKIQYDEFDEEYIVLDKEGNGVCYLNSLPEYAKKIQKESYIRNIVNDILNESKTITGFGEEREEEAKRKLMLSVKSQFDEFVKLNPKYDMVVKFMGMQKDVNGCEAIAIIARKGALSNRIIKERWDAMVQRIQSQVEKYGRVNSKGGEMVSNYQYHSEYEENVRNIDAILKVYREPEYIGETFDDID